MEKVTHDFLSKRAVAWLYEKKFKWAATEVPLEFYENYKRFEEWADAFGVGIISRDARSCVIEVKVSRGDFLSDFKKKHRLTDNPFVTERYYLAPHGMLKTEEIPERWGLLEYYPESDKILVAKRAKRRKIAYIDSSNNTIFHGNTPPWKIPLKPYVSGGVQMWATAWSAVAERYANDWRFKYVGLKKKRGKKGNGYTI